MLVLSRKVGERILIGNDIAITIVRISQGTVRIGVQAPRETSVIREEVVTISEDKLSDSINVPETPLNGQVGGSASSV